MGEFIYNMGVEKNFLYVTKNPRMIGKSLINLLYEIKKKSFGTYVTDKWIKLQY